MIEKEPKMEKTLPYDPIDAAMKTPDHARRTIQGILDSYNTNYDILAEAVQNSMDALEDAFIQKLPGPYRLDILVNLKDNNISVCDTGIGMTKEQICEAFAPAASFKEGTEIFKKRGDKFPYRGYKGVGLTFLAYGTDDVQIQSRQNGIVTKGRMRFGRKWVEKKLDTWIRREFHCFRWKLAENRRSSPQCLQQSTDFDKRSFNPPGVLIYEPGATSLAPTFG